MLTIKKKAESNRKQFAFAWVFTTIATTLAALISADAGAEILSAKRGFADTGANYNNLQATNAGWYYRWGPTKADIGNFDAEFVPMIWGGSQANQSTINTIISYGDIEWVLGFNEPERPDQANMTVAQAISAWQTLSNGFAGSGIKLISPGVADTGGATGGQAWLSSFMSQASAQGLQVDAVAFHWYGVSTPNDPIGAANSFISRVDSYHNQYGLPVWITEFAIHDWGGNYTDEEIRGANAIFLNNVIPRLESRSYVAGYAWYNWFGDSRLVEGNPLVPTNVGVPYVGTITSGNVYDFSGVDLGQHVAYLGGGELTLSSSLPSTVRYINALSGVSTISGISDWGLNSTTNWVRVQPGATLRKNGSNQITWNGISVANNGIIEVAAGVLRLENNPAVTGSGKLRVNAGGTLSLHGSRGDTTATISYPVELRGGTVSTDMVDGVTAGSGSTVSGAGTVAGNLTALSGSVVRVGADGLSAPSRFVIDDFESYALGDVRDVASPPWTAHQNTSLADIENDAGNKVLTYGWSSDFRGASSDLPDDGLIGNDQVATLFFRFNSKTDDPDHNFGLGDQANTGGVFFDDFEAQVRVTQGTSAGTFAVNARDGGTFTANLATGLTLNTWYNVWMAVDQTTDTYDVYMNTGTGDATAGNKLNAAPLDFRNGTSDSLNKILALAGPAPIDNGVRIDDLVYLSGVDLTNPLGGLDPGLIVNPATLTVQGDLTLEAGASLELDIFSPAVLDLLTVTGNLSAGGTLEVTLDASAPAPSLGDMFDILDFGSASEAFDTFNLPSLASGLVWKTSNLLTTGILEVIAAGLVGDYNNDGTVDAADYNVWRNNLGGDGSALANRDPANTGSVSEADYNSWKINFGMTIGSGAGSIASAAVPEPNTLLFALLAVCGATLLRRLRSFWDT